MIANRMLNCPYSEIVLDEAAIQNMKVVEIVRVRNMATRRMNLVVLEDIQVGSRLLYMKSKATD